MFIHEMTNDITDDVTKGMSSITNDIMLNNIIYYTLLHNITHIHVSSTNTSGPNTCSLKVYSSNNYDEYHNSVWDPFIFSQVSSELQAC